MGRAPALRPLPQRRRRPWEWHAELFAAAADAGIACFSTPFDRAAVEFLEQFDPPAYKIASFEIVDLDLIAAVAATGRPLLISTGMATRPRSTERSSAARAAGAERACAAALQQRLPGPPGRDGSPHDHRHAGRLGGPDRPVRPHPHVDGGAGRGGPRGVHRGEAPHALPIGARPGQRVLAGAGRAPALVAAIREAEAALGTVRFGPSESERPSLAFRRSLWFVQDLEPGATVTAEHVRALRPAGGLPPDRLGSVVGRRVRVAVRRGDPVVDDVLTDA